MGEVGTTSTDSPSVGTKMNGGLNGIREDEPMEVDANDSHTEPAEKPTTDSVPKEIDTVNSTKSSAEPPISEKEPADTAKDAAQQNGDDSAENKSSRNGARIDETDPKSVGSPVATSEVTVTRIVNDTAVANGDSSTKLNNGSSDGVKVAVSEMPVASTTSAKPIEPEVHSISDSEDDEPTKPASTEASNVDEAMSLVVNRVNNGDASALDLSNVNHIDNDKPVSIHSDSDDDEHPPPSGNNRNNGSVNTSSSDVHEVLSDKEDCVVIEDDGMDGNMTSAQPSFNRSRKSAMRPRDFSQFDDDIEEIIEDPLDQPASKKSRTSMTGSQLTIRDARSLAPDPLVMGKTGFQQQPYGQNNSRTNEPTLVIIDTNDILARGQNSVASSQLHALQNQNVSVMPVGASAMQSPTAYPMHSRASITPVMTNHAATMAAMGRSPSLLSTALPPIINSNLLPGLTDDMFVLEVPSFIVPYIYEKPPQESLQSIIDKIRVELKEREENDIKQKIEDASAVKDAKEMSDEKATADGGDQKKEDRKKKKKVAKSGDESWDESDESTDDEASDSEERTKVLIKEAKHDLTAIMNSPVNPLLGDPDKKDINNYFESPLGLFFMDIGINLVQEHVQTDLLRQQKKKLHREGAQASPAIQQAINALMKNLETSKGHNDVFKFSNKRCEFCNFKSESSLMMANHYETPHMKGNIYKCNFCEYEVQKPFDILDHIEKMHNIIGRLEKALPYHLCPNCEFGDNGRSKLARHSVVCAKKFKPEFNLCPPNDWEQPAKIPRIKPRHGLVGIANAHQVNATICSSFYSTIHTYNDQRICIIFCLFA